MSVEMLPSLGMTHELPSDFSTITESPMHYTHTITGSQ